ncbi:MAG: hypothetical protein JF619_21905, partial [Massilia sp.]|nr:hypothetical protein [Massilia sp.]
MTAAYGAATTPNTVDGTAAQATDATPANFALAGYDANPLAASTTDAAAPAATTTDGAPHLLA